MKKFSLLFISLLIFFAAGCSPANTAPPKTSAMADETPISQEEFVHSFILAFNSQKVTSVLGSGTLLFKVNDAVALYIHRNNLVLTAPADPFVQAGMLFNDEGYSNNHWAAWVGDEMILNSRAAPAFDELKTPVEEQMSLPWLASSLYRANRNALRREDGFIILNPEHQTLVLAFNEKGYRVGIVKADYHRSSMSTDALMDELTQHGITALPMNDGAHIMFMPQ